MQISHSATYANQPLHDWLRSVKVAYVPGQTTSLLEEVVTNLLDRFKLRGHDVQKTPDDSTDVLLTTAPFGEPLDWREAMLFTARRRFKLSHTPTILTLLHITPERFHSLLDHFHRALSRPEPDGPYRSRLAATCCGQLFASGVTFR